MRTVKINPESVNNEHLEGWVEVTIPHYVEKMKQLREMKFKIDAKGDITVAEDTFETLEAMGHLAEKVILSAEIKRKEDGHVYGKEDIFFEPDLAGVIMEVASAYMNGFKPSKKLSNPLSTP